MIESKYKDIMIKILTDSMNIYKKRKRSGLPTTPLCKNIYQLIDCLEPYVQPDDEELKTKIEEAKIVIKYKRRRFKLDNIAIFSSINEEETPDLKEVFKRQLREGIDIYLHIEAGEINLSMHQLELVYDLLLEKINSLYSLIEPKEDLLKVYLDYSKLALEYKKEKNKVEMEQELLKEKVKSLNTKQKIIIKNQLSDNIKKYLKIQSGEIEISHEEAKELYDKIASLIDLLEPLVHPSEERLWAYLEYAKQAINYLSVVQTVTTTNIYEINADYGFILEK